MDGNGCQLQPPCKRIGARGNNGNQLFCSEEGKNGCNGVVWWQTSIFENVLVELDGWEPLSNTYAKASWNLFFECIPKRIVDSGPGIWFYFLVSFVTSCAYKINTFANDSRNWLENFLLVRYHRVPSITKF